MSHFSTSVTSTELMPPNSPLTFNSYHKDNSLSIDHQWKETVNNSKGTSLWQRTDSKEIYDEIKMEREISHVDKVISVPGAIEPNPEPRCVDERDRNLMKQQSSSGNMDLLQSDSSFNQTHAQCKVNFTECGFEIQNIAGSDINARTIRQPTHSSPNHIFQKSIPSSSSTSSKQCQLQMEHQHYSISTILSSYSKTFRRLALSSSGCVHDKSLHITSSFDSIKICRESKEITEKNTMTASSENCHNIAQDEINHARLIEMRENDSFALEVGLMFSTEEGDSIANADLYSQCIQESRSMESDKAMSSFDFITSLKYLSYRDDGGRQLLSTRKNDDSISAESSNYIQNPSYMVCRHQYSKGENGQNYNTDDQSLGESTFTAGQTTVRDDHGNKVPQNAKVILGYSNAKNKRVDLDDKHPSCNIFSQVQDLRHISGHPQIQKVDPNAQRSLELMEKRLRELAGQLSSEWRSGSTTFIDSPALARRLRDFQFAREKRRKKYGSFKPWGILGLYEHLSGVRVDVEWAENAAWRRYHGEPYLTWCDFESMKNMGVRHLYLTYFLVFACTAMMIASFFVNGCKFEPIAVNPMIGPSAETLITLGAKDSYLIVQENEIWRLVSPMILHAGLIHFFLNIFALWYVGKAIEQIHGFFLALVQFVIPALGGTILSAIFLPEYITVGSSGGIFGLIGGCISDVTMNWNLLFNEFVIERGARISHIKILLVLLLDIIVNCLIGLTPFVDNFTHIGGMIYGFLCGLSTIQMVSPKFFGDEKPHAYNAKFIFFRFFGIFVSIGSLFLSSVILFWGDGKTNPCPSCSIISCITFPPWEDKNNKWWYCDDCETLMSAEVTLNSETGQVIELMMTCPSDEIVNISSHMLLPEEDSLKEMLPMICREYCF